MTLILNHRIPCPGKGLPCDSSIYDRDPWWQPESALYLLKSTVNPVRTSYFRKVLAGLHRGSALEIGCGGGILCEEIAAMGFRTTGIDPSEASLQVAAGHARTRRRQ